MEHFNSTFYLWTFSVEVVACIAVILNCSIAIVVLSLKTTLIATASLILRLTVFGNLEKVNEGSKRLILTCRSIRSDPLLRRKLIATKKVRVKVGSFFYVDRSLILTILSISLTNTANVVMGSMNSGHE